jgi:hypothetical protein
MLPRFRNIAQCSLIVPSWQTRLPVPAPTRLISLPRSRTDLWHNIMIGAAAVNVHQWLTRSTVTTCPAPTVRVSPRQTPTGAIVTGTPSRIDLAAMKPGHHGAGDATNYKREPCSAGYNIILSFYNREPWSAGPSSRPGTPQAAGQHRSPPRPRHAGIDQLQHCNWSVA